MSDASAGAATEAVVAPIASRRRWVPLLLIGVAIVVYAADQLSKNWVVANLPEGETTPVFGDVLQWHFVRNPGAAFSMATGSTWVFTILAAVVVVVILWQLRRLRSISWGLFLGLLLGGVLGNLTDRLTREPGFPEGHVIDFILTPWMWLGFPPAIYNIADIGIVSGMLLFVVVTLFGLPIDGSPRTRRGAGADDGADAAEQDPFEDEAVAAGGANADASSEGDADALKASARDEDPATRAAEEERDGTA